MTRTTPTRPRRIAAAAGGLAIAATLGLGACSAGGNDSASEPASSQPTAAGGAADRSRADSSAAPRGQDQKAATRSVLAPETAKLARKAKLEITVDDITKAAASIRSTAASQDGAITSEEISTDEDHGWGELVVSVPSDSLDKSIDELSRVGTVERRSTSTEDLTSQYTDTDSRIKTAQASIKRVRALINSTDDIKQLVELESELSTREGDLESLQAQLETLKHKTSMSPITVSLREKGAPVDDPEDETGFVAGLGAGWGAFTDALTLGMTALGALTPFLVMGALVLAPVVVWWRRRVSPAVAPAASAPARPRE